MVREGDDSVDAIIVEGLVKEFGKFRAVDELSFTVPKGKIFALLGPNGSGKSTTIRMLCALMTPTAGKATVLNYDVVREGEKIKECIGYMSQGFSLYTDLTARENLEFYAGIYSLKKEVMKKRIEEVLKLTLLDAKPDAIVGQLSGGWKQRVALACAIMHRPQLLVLDEPTAGVDPVSRRVFWSIIKGLAVEGITILVTTHYMDEAAQADLVALMYSGKLRDFGSPEELEQRWQKDTLEDVFIAMVEEHRSLTEEVSL